MLIQLYKKFLLLLFIVFTTFALQAAENELKIEIELLSEYSAVSEVTKKQRGG